MDPILYWNDVALEANRESHTNGLNENTGPTLSSRALAIIHLAMHDAYFGIVTGVFPTYVSGLPAPAPGAAPDAAVAAAAYFTLVQLFPGQEMMLEAKLAAAPISAAGASEGRTFGLAVGEAIFNLRRDDPDASDRGYSASIAFGAHRPDPDNPTQGFHAPFYGARARGFAVTRLHTLNAPPLPGQPEYTAALREVRVLGIAPELAGTLPPGTKTRTPEQTLIGIYWAYDGSPGLGTPPRFLNQIVRKIAIARNNSVAKNARLFALVNAAMGDAGIFAWREKYRHDLWRPVVGIREHDRSMGPTAMLDPSFSKDCDPFWLPLGSPSSNTRNKNFTPAFPAYPSGHATFGAAAFQITRLFYGIAKPGPDDLLKDMAVVSDELNGMTTDNRGAARPIHARGFKDGLWGAIEENGRSRVFLGIHWIFDAFTADDAGKYMQNVGGVPLGLAIAKDIFDHGLKPSP